MPKRGAVRFPDRLVEYLRHSRSIDRSSGAILSDRAGERERAWQRERRAHERRNTCVLCSDRFDTCVLYTARFLHFFVNVVFPTSRSRASSFSLSLSLCLSRFRVASFGRVLFFFKVSVHWLRLFFHSKTCRMCARPRAEIRSRITR